MCRMIRRLLELIGFVVDLDDMHDWDDDSLFVDN